MGSKNTTGLRTSRICFRLSPDLYEYIKELQIKTGKSESEIVRSILEAARSGQSIKMESKDTLIWHKQLINEINAIGTNINQIVKNNNSGFYNPYEKNELFALMQNLIKIVEKNI